MPKPSARRGVSRRSCSSRGPRIEEPVYFIDGGGQRWRVWDYTYGPPENPPGKRTVRRPPLPSATYRAFVSADGVQRLYRFERGEDRSLTVERLERQLREAAYAPTAAFDPTTHGPR